MTKESVTPSQYVTIRKQIQSQADRAARGVAQYTSTLLAETQGERQLGDVEASEVEHLRRVLHRWEVAFQQEEKIAATDLAL